MAMEVHYRFLCLFALCFVVFGIQWLFQSTWQTYDPYGLSGSTIYRGSIDRFSTYIPYQITGNLLMWSFKQRSCLDSETFTYNERSHTGKCEKNYRFVLQSGCTSFSNFEWIKILHTEHSPTVRLSFPAQGTCTWKNTEYSVYGNHENWQPTANNLGSISVENWSFDKILQINNPGELLSTFSGILLRLQIKCVRNGLSGENNLKNICLILKVQGRTNIATIPDLNQFIGKREGDKNNSSSLESNLVPISLLCVLIIVLFGVLVFYRRRRRSMSASIDKGFYKDGTKSQQQTL